jgi:hypothetical protein
MIKKITLSVALILATIGCATKSIYYWDNYESVVYDHYNESASPLKEIELLRKDEAKSSSTTKPLPPGFYAYLGYLYYQVGNFNMANESFAKERNRFAESKVLMNRFLKTKK